VSDKFSASSIHTNHIESFSLIYPQTVTLYQVDDQIYEPEEVATTNLFNTFLDALDGVCIISTF